MEGLIIDQLSRPILHDMPEVHDRQDVANILDHIEIVSDEKVAKPQFLLEAVQEVDDLGLDGNVEG